MPQIFVQTPNGPKTVDVELTDTIAEVKQKALAKMDATDKVPVLLFKNKVLDDARTLADYEIGNEATLQMGLAPRAMGAAAAAAAQGSGVIQVHATPPPDPTVTMALRQRLAAIAEKPRRFLFVSIGSYLHGKKESAEAMRQQCPPEVLEFCRQNGLELDIILIDQGFGSHADDSDTAEKPQNPQLNNLLPGWAREATLWGGKVRHYKNAQLSAVLSVYGTSVPDEEWAPGAKTLGGLSLAALADRLTHNAGILHIQHYNGKPLFSTWKG